LNAWGGVLSDSSPAHRGLPTSWHPSTVTLDTPSGRDDVAADVGSDRRWVLVCLGSTDQ